MDWNFSEEQIQVRDLARQILTDMVTNESLKDHEAGKSNLTSAVWSALAEANLTGVAIPEAYGGAGLDFMTLALVLVEIGRTTAPVPLHASLVCGGVTLAQFGTDAQKESWLPGIADGSKIATAALTEFGAEDPLHPLLQARRDGNEFVLDGVKSMVRDASTAAVMLVPARLEDGGVCVFLVEPSTTGLKFEPMLTACQNPHDEVTFEGVRVREADAVGGLAGGEAVLQGLVEVATIGLCALQLGVSERALEMTGEYARERVQFDRPIGSFQAVHQRAADAFIQTEGVRLSTFEACWRISQGLDAETHVKVAKFWASEGGQFTAYACQHLHGGIGIDMDYPLHRYFVWSIQIEHSLGSARAQLAHLGEEIAEHGLPVF